MAVTQIVLDRQAVGRIFAFGGTGAGTEALVTINKGTTALTTVVLDVKASQNIAGNLNVIGDINVTGSLNTVSVNDLHVADRTIRVNVGGATPADDLSGLQVEGTAGALIGAIYYKAASASKFSIGDGTTQRDIVDVSSTQTLTNKSIAGTQITGNISGNAANVTGIVLVPNGGTGLATTTAYGVITGGTTATGNFQNAGTGTTGQILTSNGAAALPTWQTPGASSTYQRATVVTGTQDSVNKVFTIANAVSAGSEQIYLNGQLLTPGSSNDYVISGTTVTFQAAITAPAATDVIRAYGTF